MSLKTVLLIISCKKYEYKATIQKSTWLPVVPASIPYFHVIGDPDKCWSTNYCIDYDNRIIYTNTPDTYAALPYKVITAIQAVHEHMHYDYIYKTDDDQILIRPDFFIKLTEKLDNGTYHYGGNAVVLDRDHISTYWKEHDDLPRDLPMEKTTYCSGRFYLLSHTAVISLLRNKESISKRGLEDHAIGYYLSDECKSNILKLNDEITDSFVDIDVFAAQQYSRIHKMTKMVAIELSGQIGDQLFQIGAAYAYAKKEGGSLQIICDPAYYNQLYWDNILSRFKIYLVKSIPKDLEIWKENYPTMYTPISPLTMEGKKLCGYFQTSKYFYNQTMKNEIKSLFKPNPELVNNIAKQYAYFIENKDRVVIVHAMANSYRKAEAFHGILPKIYYKYAVKYMNTRVKNPIFLLCGDDTEYWMDFVNDEDNMSKQFQFILLDDKSDITMFILLQQFKHYIMSNSSYSWWHVWLSEAKNVITPFNWFGPEGPAEYIDVYEDNWKLL